MGHTARADIESLLRARKLDVTLTSAVPWTRTLHDPAPAGIGAIDAALGGGLPRGQLSEIVGPRSSGRTLVCHRVLASAAERGEAVALIDASDRFDPASAAAAGVDLTKLLWVRDTGDAARALKALNLVLQAGGFGIVVLDVADIPSPALRRFPHTTWMRIARVIEGSQTVALLVGGGRTGRSPAGVTIALDAAPGASRGRWSGPSDRARLLAGIDITPRVIGSQLPIPNAQLPRTLDFGV
ncbi:MAG: hypothetical protein A3H96_27440 [Acidobacteria bacterium RIFCSPLOWO2_02_FULL_67_36]|nr:MAG: hypothetical protein A3H96_27440 [Acidobacteria bacterium RIFCSPLOWO2_02_FULL_67_36]OFW26402.1 MAG: hypothetical protein A3G21_27360 [Acidobacteria bacterium RIFCSPLOWO2_12_FULL_66_21]